MTVRLALVLSDRLEPFVHQYVIDMHAATGRATAGRSGGAPLGLGRGRYSGYSGWTRRGSNAMPRSARHAEKKLCKCQLFIMPRAAKGKEPVKHCGRQREG